MNQAFDRLEEELPSPAARFLEWLRNPKVRYIRLFIGFLLILASFFWFLPVIGLELLPIGLLIIAIDVPFLQKPIASFVMWGLRKWAALRAWWRRRRRKGR
ncbi:hypothetical protein [Niveispirillum fermenti]|uniref:hypothetical protein n=1 Tax=Niveispirillum fermenti TaxID=1233113 RepID=UPI003A86103C